MEIDVDDRVPLDPDAGRRMGLREREVSIPHQRGKSDNALPIRGVVSVVLDIERDGACAVA